MKNKNAILDIGRFHHLFVRYIVDRPISDPLLGEILKVACQGKVGWNVGEWDDLIKYIRSSTLTVGEFLTECENEGASNE